MAAEMSGPAKPKAAPVIAQVTAPTDAKGRAAIPAGVRLVQTDFPCPEFPQMLDTADQQKPISASQHDRKAWLAAVADHPDATWMQTKTKFTRIVVELRGADGAPVRGCDVQPGGLDLELSLHKMVGDEKESLLHDHNNPREKRLFAGVAGGPYEPRVKMLEARHEFRLKLMLLSNDIQRSPMRLVVSPTHADYARHEALTVRTHGFCVRAADKAYLNHIKGATEELGAQGAEQGAVQATTGATGKAAGASTGSPPLPPLLSDGASSSSAAAAQPGGGASAGEGVGAAAKHIVGTKSRKWPSSGPTRIEYDCASCRKKCRTTLPVAPERGVGWRQEALCQDCKKRIPTSCEKHANPIAIKVMPHQGFAISFAVPVLASSQDLLTAHEAPLSPLSPLVPPDTVDGLPADIVKGDPREDSPHINLKSEAEEPEAPPEHVYPHARVTFLERQLSEQQRRSEQRVQALEAQLRERSGELTTAYARIRALTGDVRSSSGSGDQGEGGGSGGGEADANGAGPGGGREPVNGGGGRAEVVYGVEVDDDDDEGDDDDDDDDAEEAEQEAEQEEEHTQEEHWVDPTEHLLKRNAGTSSRSHPAKRLLLDPPPQQPQPSQPEKRLRTSPTVEQQAGNVAGRWQAATSSSTTPFPPPQAPVCPVAPPPPPH